MIDRLADAAERECSHLADFRSRTKSSLSSKASSIASAVAMAAATENDGERSDLLKTLLYLPINFICKRGLESFIDLLNLFCSTALKSRICVKQNVRGIVHAFLFVCVRFFLGNFCI